MAKRYRVVFLGLLKGDADFKAGMGGLGVPPDTVEEIVAKAPVILKEDLPLRNARQYADAVQGAGGRVNIEEHGSIERPESMRRIAIKPLDTFMMCPECGYKQLKSEACVKCGFKPGEERLP
jgi:hypothetical protein